MAAKKKATKKTGKSTKKKSSFTPANRFLRYQLTTPGNGVENSEFIDLAKSLSALNRRLYRQGKVYQVANISVTSRNTANGLVSFSTAPDTWVTRGAWHRGFKAHQDMQKLVTELPGSEVRKGRYNDFKVYLSNDHRTAAATRPLDNGNNMVFSGEWIYSEFRTPDGVGNNSDMFVAHLLGDHVGSAGSRTSVGLIKSYGESRATVHASSPNVDSDGSDDPLMNLFDAGTQVDEIAEDLLNDGDAPPYAMGSGSTTGDVYPGANSNVPKPMVNRLAAIGQQGGSSAPTIMLPGFTAIAGLIEVEMQSDATSPDTFDILIELAPGSYKGVAAFDI